MFLFNLEHYPVFFIYSYTPVPCKISSQRFRLANTIIAVSINTF